MTKYRYRPEPFGEAHTFHARLTNGEEERVAVHARSTRGLEEATTEAEAITVPTRSVTDDLDEEITTTHTTRTWRPA